MSNGIACVTYDRIGFSPEAQGNTDLQEGWSWPRPRGFTSTGRELVIDQAKFRHIGVYEVTLNAPNGCVIKRTFIVAVVPAPFTGRCYGKDAVQSLPDKWFPNPIIV